MTPQPKSSVLLTFGPFEVDPRAVELRKHGIRIRLSGQPLRILSILLEHPGELVTREQLREQIWNDGTFVDFEGGLNAAINKLRRALSDSAEKPRYIETVPTQGYRFIGPVRELAHPGGELLKAATSAPAPARRSNMMVPAAVLALLAVLAAGYFHFRSKPKLTDKDAVILADFINKTGDPVFDETLRQGLAIQLEQSPFLSLVSEQRIQQVLRLMNQPADARLSPQLAQDICERTAAAAVLEGSIASLGSQYVLGLRARDCRTGDIIDEEQVQAVRKEDVLTALSQTAGRFRSRVGESLAMVEKHDTPLAEATTPSLDALKAYSSAQRAMVSAGDAAALPLFRHSVELDSGFALAYAWMGRLYGDLEDPARSAESTRRAWQLRDRASEPEKFYIAASYDLQVTGNLEMAQQTCEAWAQTYPRETAPLRFLGLIYTVTGRPEKGLESYMKASDLDPDNAPQYALLANRYQYLDRLGEAENILHQAAARKLDIPDLSVARYDIAFLRGDKVGMDREATSSRGKSGTEDWVSDHEAFMLAYSGRLGEAMRMSQHAASLALQAAHPERAALYGVPAALWCAFFGNTSEVRREAMAALRLSRELYVEYGAAFALAVAGDSPEAETLEADLERRFGEDTGVRTSYLPALRARLALNSSHNRLGEPRKSIELLQAAAPYELGVPRSAIHGNFGAFYPIYVRGEAFLAARDGREAAAEFRKILDHPGIVASDPIGALARLQIGRAFAMSGDTTRARAAYRDFLALWKGADAGIPVLKQARAEFAKLN